MTVRRRAFPLVLAAPSGSGKTSIARALVERNERFVFSVSATTRQARRGERNGVDYLFVDDAAFARMIESGELLEWAVVHGRRYGTPKAAVEEAVGAGRVVVLDIDVQGARQVRGAFPDAVLVFVLPPSADELVRRLSRRRSEDTAELRRRLENALVELRDAPEFDFVIVNEDLDAAVADVEAIVRGEWQRRSRIEDLEGVLADLDREIRGHLSRSG